MVGVLKGYYLALKSGLKESWFSVLGCLDIKKV
jgi:hypothetical protein